MNKNKKSKFFSLLCVGILGMSLGSCTSTEQTTSSFISSSTTSSSSDLNSSSSISEEEQHLEKLNNYIQEALHEGKQINTMHEVIEVLNTNGVTTQQLKTEDKVFLFDLESKNFTVSNKTSLTETEDPNLWIVVSSEEWEEKTIETIKKAAYTGNPGDGKIFSYYIRKAVKIRTGETGYDAVQSTVDE